MRATSLAMLFMGGKARWANKLAAELEVWRVPGEPILELCCGAGNVTAALAPPRVAVDANPALIGMWRAAQAGWLPPPRSEITKELYAEYKKKPLDFADPMTAFLLFGCSFRGVWRGGFAHTHTAENGRQSDFVDQSRRALVKKIERVKGGTEFVLASFADVAMPEPGRVVYADPPYGNTADRGIGEKGSLVAPFDHAAFWTQMTTWSKSGVLVFVSEETAPDDWVRFRSWQTKRGLGNWSANAKTTMRKLESLWVHRDSKMAASASEEIGMAG